MIKKVNISKTIFLIAAAVGIIGSTSSCKKDWLNAKPNKSLIVPNTISNYQALLDNTDLMNNNHPGISVVSDDNFYVTPTTFQSLTLQERSAYLWEDTDKFYGGQSAGDWQNAYTRILRDNIILDGIQNIKVDPSSLTPFNNVKGSALFLRSLDFYNLAQIYANSFNAEMSTKDPGLVIRTASDVNLVLKRSNLKETYDQIVNDLLMAIPLLPITPLFPTRPSKPAAYALLSRVYLSQQDYPKSLLYADSCLQLKKSLMDFNTLATSAAQPFQRFNEEVIFHYNQTNYGVFRTSRLIVAPDLIQSYEVNDLRAGIFFISVSGNKSFKGSYDGSNAFFGGLATDEMYLNRAECYAREGNLQASLKDLNTLLKTRWKTNPDGSSTYIPKTAIHSEEALKIILQERRKELCFRGLRWTDLRRLNKDDRFKVTINRTIGSNTYTLTPNSARYTLPIDDKEVLIGGLEQNSR